jgi:alpha-L-fucosidase
MEWGMGDEKPEQFNPTELDCRQWARVCKEAGMKGIIITAKHHDGFCLWPSKYTEHSVKNAPWKNGKGDVVKELSEACKEFGLKFGVYLSPWDRNHPDYGKPEYITYFRNQLTELLTNYGDVFEVWFDGANGGTGYYGGANEDRRVDKKSYYDWENTFKLIRKLQPNTIIWSDAGPDARWVGNEHGYAYPTTWATLMRDSVYGGMPEYAKKYSSGQENGTHWVPAEADVSIRPGWYYHPYEDHKVHSLPHLLDIYYKSIGQNSSLLLNFPVDTRGLIHENDIENLQKLTAKLKEDFAVDLVKHKKATASNERGKQYQAQNVLDGNKNSYWATEDDHTTGSLTIDFKENTTFNRFLVQEYYPYGQRVKAFTLEAKIDGNWKEIASETTIGVKRILRLPNTTATAIRFNIIAAKACPLISIISVYNAPKLVLPPTINRNRAGKITLKVPEEGVKIYYTTDGSTPTKNSIPYLEEFELSSPSTIQAIAIVGDKKSDISRRDMDIPTKDWTILGAKKSADKVLDGNTNSWWQAQDNQLLIDLGATINLKGFNYLPMQGKWFQGAIKEFECAVSMDNKKWKVVKKGEFSNIQNSPILQRVSFPAIKGRYIRLKALTTIDNKAAAFAEFEVLTK